jgi:hypothetical protein
MASLPEHKSVFDYSRRKSWWQSFILRHLSCKSISTGNRERDRGVSESLCLPLFVTHRRRHKHKNLHTSSFVGKKRQNKHTRKQKGITKIAVERLVPPTTDSSKFHSSKFAIEKLLLNGLLKIFFPFPFPSTGGYTLGKISGFIVPFPFPYHRWRCSYC